MKIVCNFQEYDDGERQIYSIEIDGNLVLNVNASVHTPEDMNFNRNLSDVKDLPSVFKMIADAVKNGEEVIIEETEENKY